MSVAFPRRRFLDADQLTDSQSLGPPDLDSWLLPCVVAPEVRASSSVAVFYISGCSSYTPGIILYNDPYANYVAGRVSL